MNAWTWTVPLRFVGYGTKTFRELQAKLELLGAAYGKTKAESAQSHLTTNDGQLTCKMWDAFDRNPDGSPMAQHTEKMAELAERTGKKPSPHIRAQPQAELKKRSRKKAG